MIDLNPLQADNKEHTFILLIILKTPVKEILDLNMQAARCPLAPTTPSTTRSRCSFWVVFETNLCFFQITEPSTVNAEESCDEKIHGRKDPDRSNTGLDCGHL